MLAERQVPAVTVVGVVVDRADQLDAVLVTEFLEYSISYRTLFSNPRGDEPAIRLIDGIVELLVRLHLVGFYWGDCSLSNTLFRLDAGSLAAYMVDAETGELQETLSDRMREYDIALASEKVAGELYDLQAGGLLPPDVDPIEVAEHIPQHYHWLWDELTRVEVLKPDEQRYRIAARLERLNDLGFDVDEVELIGSDEGNRLRLRTRVAESGYHRRRLYMQTGLDVEENQARRLLNDIASFRGYVRQKEGRKLPDAVVASRWLTEVYDPVRRRDPGRAARPAAAGPGVPRDPRPPLVPVRGGRPRRRHHRRRALVLRDGPAGRAGGADPRGDLRRRRAGQRPRAHHRRLTHRPAVGVGCAPIADASPHPCAGSGPTRVDLGEPGLIRAKWAPNHLDRWWRGGAQTKKRGPPKGTSLFSESSA